ncbi:MAG: STAS domain-containing protein [Anaerolineae bacterium]|nr:STAS domain-containing protein [Anaerolineae bacterium]
MEVHTTHHKRCSVVSAAGRVDSQTAPELAQAFKEITEENDVYKIVLDMAGVEFISSAGLRVLIDVQKTCRRWNRGELILAGVPKVIYDALDLAGFIPLFKFFDDVTSAVGSF